MKELMNIKGKYTVESLNIETGERKKKEVYNVICQGFFDGLWDFLDYTAQTPSADVLDLTYFATGTGTTAAVRADTTLETEDFRKAFSQKSFTDAKFTAKTVIAAGEGNPTGGFITEVGVFAGGSATPDSGILCSRAIVNVEKNSNIQLIITWDLEG